MELSVVIPAHNEAALIADTVVAVHAAASPLGIAYEVIVANDASDDDTGAIAAAAGARVVPTGVRQIAGARNAGARAAVGRYLVFVDADTLVSPGTLRGAVGALRAGCIGGGAAIAYEASASWGAHFAVHLWNWVARTMGWAAGSFFFARRDAFEQVGGFDERYYAGEEIYLAIALERKGTMGFVEVPVVTSARKERTHSILQALIPVFKAVFTGGLSLRRRDRFWYDGKRESVPG